MRILTLVLLLASLPLRADAPRLVASGPVCSHCGSVVADVNGDGLDDLASDSAIVFNLGGTFSEPVSVIGFKPSDMAVVWGDFNGDGFADVFVRALQPWSMPGSPAYTPDRLLTGNGLGRFLAARYDFGTLARVWRAADVDADGKLDVVLAENDERIVLHNEGGAAFSQSAIAGEVDLAAGDLDGDGLADVVTAARLAAAQPDSLHIQFGKGTVYDLFTGVEPRAIQIADVNGDHRLDLVIDDVSSRSWGLTAFFGDGAGGFPEVTRVPVDDPMLAYEDYLDPQSVIGDFFAGGGAEIARVQDGAVVVYSAAGDKLHEVARYTPEYGHATAVASGNFIAGARPELVVNVSGSARAGRYLLVPEGFVPSRRRAVRGVVAPDRVSGSWLVQVEDDCALPALGEWTFVRHAMAVEVKPALNLTSALVAYVPGDETLTMRLKVGTRDLHGEPHLDADGAIRGTLTEDVTPCSMRLGSHRLTLTRSTP